jgi:hypothetical protein
MSEGTIEDKVARLEELRRQVEAAWRALPR